MKARAIKRSCIAVSPVGLIEVGLIEVGSTELAHNWIIVLMRKYLNTTKNVFSRQLVLCQYHLGVRGAIARRSTARMAPAWGSESYLSCFIY
jgi:hypothetical protein